MATSGDLSRTSYRGGLRLAAALVLVCLLAASCQSSPAGGHKAPSDAEANGARQMWCKAKPDGAWKKVLNRDPVALSRYVSVVPIALADDGRSFFASIWSKRYSGLVRIDAGRSRYTKIKRYRDPVNDQASGSFDGRWLVWTEYHSLYDPSDFDVWSWDSRTGRLRQIGAAARSSGGKFWPSSWRAAVALDGYATWEQGSGPDSLGDIHVVDLESGRGRIARHGHPVGSFLVAGPLVVWPESMKRGALTVMRAADAKTGRPVSTPLALRRVRGGLEPATNGEAVVYATDDWRSLWWSPSLKTAPRRVFSSRAGEPMENSVRVNDRYVSFAVWPRIYLADASVGRYLQINSPGGGVFLGKTNLLLGKQSAEKAIHPISETFFTRLKSLPPIPPCE